MSKKVPSNDKDLSAPLNIKRGDKKWDILRKYPHDIDDYIHKNNGPWPQPAPANPLGQMAEVIHLPEEEIKDWKWNVRNMYIWRLLTRWPEGLMYIFKHDKYVEMNDAQFKDDITKGIYSKFMSPLDTGDLKLFKQFLPKLKGTEASYVKADFSCMEGIAPHCFEGMSAAPTITLISKSTEDDGSHSYEPVAIYLYEVDENNLTKKTTEEMFTAVDGDNWHLAKYFVLQGALHRINLIEHPLLHFPFDCINAITKTILPTSHLLFQLLIPHLRLSLGVNHSVLESSGSLINRKKHKFYSPFCAEDKYIRELLSDGYVGREGKKNSYPPYTFPLTPDIRIPDSDYGVHLRAYYDVFADFVPKVLSKIDDDDEESWVYIGLWADSIDEWMPGFPTSKELVKEVQTKQGKRMVPTEKARDILKSVLTMIMWDLSVAHATDHIAIHEKGPIGSPFRVRTSIPRKGVDPEKNWREKLVHRKDLLTFWFTDLLFYLPNNVTKLEYVEYSFKLPKEQAEKEAELKLENRVFRQTLKSCEAKLIREKIKIPAKLDQISSSLQY